MPHKTTKIKVFRSIYPKKKKNQILNQSRKDFYWDTIWIKIHSTHLVAIKIIIANKATNRSYRQTCASESKGLSSLRMRRVIIEMIAAILAPFPWCLSETSNWAPWENSIHSWCAPRLWMKVSSHLIQVKTQDMVTWCNLWSLAVFACLVAIHWPYLNWDIILAILLPFSRKTARKIARGSVLYPVLRQKLSQKAR